ncbi:MAG: hypothetical protein Q8N26_18895 [Myxococcales bacterium]|nr:hypothetical protein [Myxococcales bacterium]
MRLRFLVLAVLGCSPPVATGPGTLSLKARPTALKNDGSLARLTITALTAGETVGVGRVKLRVPAGLFDSDDLELDGFGSAETSYRCDKAIDPGCDGSVTIVAEWLDGRELVKAQTTVRLGTTVTSPSCDFGTARSTATTGMLDLFGQTVFFNAGQPLPAGRYRIKYSDGCMKYASDQSWTIHAYADGRAAWWLVGQTSATKITMPPGTVGFDTSNGAFATFAECVAANRAVAAKEFDFSGGVIGVWLQDSPYSDNLAGEAGRNPSWQLTTPSCP